MIGDVDAVGAAPPTHALASHAIVLQATLFPDLSGHARRERSLPWSKWTEHLRSPRTYPAKERMPLIKLARFGDARSDAGSFRHDANIVMVDGVEGDYDGGEVTLADAATMLAGSDVRAVVYSSPSSTPERPRWRVLAPLSEPCEPSRRREYVGRLNAVLGGILAPESFVLSQAFYIGRAETAAHYEVQEVAGERCIDEIAVEPRYPVNGHAGNGAHVGALSAATEAVDTDPILRALRERALLKRQVKAGTWAITCPWESEHTTTGGDAATAYLQASFDGRQSAGFSCKHGHCADRRLGDLLLFLGLREPAKRAIARANAPGAPEHHPFAVDAPGLESGAAPWPEPLAAEAYHGLAGEFVRMVEPDTEADPAALLIQFLTAFGVYVGRGPHYFVEGAEHHGNLFAVLVGETAKGRKGTSWARVAQVFHAVPGWKREVSGLSSGEGFKYQVRDPRESVKEKNGERSVEVVDAGVADKRLLVQEPEFASVLRAGSRQGNTLTMALRQAWDTGNLNTLTKNDPIAATGAHVGIVAHVTADELRAELTQTDTANGFANRFLFVMAKRSKLLPFGGRTDPDTLAPLSTRIRSAAELARTRGRISMSKEAAAIWCKVYAELSEARAGLYGYATGRAEAQTVRIALVYALLDGVETIDAPHLLAALAVWQYADASARYIFGSSLGDKIADEILRRLRQAGDAGLTRNDLRDAFQRNVPADRIGTALELLQRKGRAIVEKVATEGRPSEVWRITK